MQRLPAFSLAVCVVFLANLGDAYAIDLVGVYQQAKTSAPVLQSYDATEQAAEQGYYSALGGLFPSLSLTATGAGQAYDTTGYSGQYLYEKAGLSLTQPILNLNLWGQALNQSDISAAAKATYEYNVQNFILTVSTDYFNILADQDTLVADKAAVSFYYETMKQTQEKFQAGLSTIKDLKQAEANYDLNYATEIKDQSQWQIDVSNLAKLTGVRYTDLASPKDSFPFSPPDPADIDIWVKRAEVGNKNLQAQNFTAAAAKQTVVMNAGNQLPQISFVGTYGLTDTNASGLALSNNFSNETFAHNWTISLNATWNIFDGGTSFANALSAARSYDAATQTALQTDRDTIAQTRRDYLSIISDVSQVQALKQAVVSDELSLKQLDEEYKVGTETIVNVLDQANQLFSDRKSYTQAEYQYMTDTLTLQRDVGSLALPEITALNQWLTLSNPNLNLNLNLNSKV